MPKVRSGEAVRAIKAKDKPTSNPPMQPWMKRTAMSSGAWEMLGENRSMTIRTKKA